MSTFHSDLLLGSITIWCVLVCWTDVRTRKIPNLLSTGGGLVALAIRYLLGDSVSFISGLMGGAVCGLLFLIFNFFSWLGQLILKKNAGTQAAIPIAGGDIKMLFSAGAIAGLPLVPILLFFMSIASVVYGTVMMIAGHVDPARLRHGFRSLFDWRYDREKGREKLPSQDDEAGRIPFSPAIAFGLLIALMGGG